jgi:hypothetical protein
VPHFDDSQSPDITFFPPLSISHVCLVLAMLESVIGSISISLMRRLLLLPINPMRNIAFMLMFIAIQLQFGLLIGIIEPVLMTALAYLPVTIFAFISFAELLPHYSTPFLMCATSATVALNAFLVTYWVPALQATVSPISNDIRDATHLVCIGGVACVALWCSQSNLLTLHRSGKRFPIVRSVGTNVLRVVRSGRHLDDGAS